MAQQPRVPPSELKHLPKTRWAWLLATWFGAGYCKPGPGTYGSAAAVILWYATARIFAPAPTILALSTGVAAIVITWIGVHVSTIAARESGRKDPGFVVIDEVAGQLFALMLTPAAGPRAWVYALLALVLFRAFDITKPWPIRKLEALPEGTGIMLDDVAAGILALIAGEVILRCFALLH